MSKEAARSMFLPFETAAIAQSDRGKRVKQRDYLSAGRIPVIDQGQSPIGGYTNDEALAFQGELPVVLFGDHTRVVKLVDHPFAVGADGIKIFRPSSGVRAKYLFYWIKAAPLPDRGYGRHYQYLRQLSISVPSPAEQDEIVAEVEKQFSRLDEAVTCLRRVKVNLKRYRATVLRSAVEGRLVATEAEIAQRENREFQTGEALRDLVLQRRRSEWAGTRPYREPCGPLSGWVTTVPEGWAVASLEAIASANRVICYGILMPKENVADGVLYVKVRDMKNDAIEIASLHRTTHEIAAKYARASLRTGDLLLSIRGTYGRVATVPAALDGGNITQDTARLDISNLVNSAFVSLYLKSDAAQNYFKFVARGVAVKGVNIGDLRPMAIPLPPITEQHRIVGEAERRLSLIREIEAEVDMNLLRARALREKTLAHFFSRAAPSVER